MMNDIDPAATPVFRITAKKTAAYHPLGREDELLPELLLWFTLSPGLTGTPVFAHKNGVYIRVSGESGRLRTPVHHCELKLYFPDFKNYYYLPAEDMAVHKSVSRFVDPSHRVRATKDTCYVKKEGDFLPILTDRWGRVEDSFTKPVLRITRTDRRRFTPYDEKQDMDEWLAHVLLHLLPSYFAGFS